MSLIPDSVAEFTPTTLSSLLHAGGTLSPLASVTSARCTPLGNGQVAQVLRIMLEYDRPGAGPSSIVAKLPADSASRRQFAQALGAYDTEVRFYQEIAPRIDMSVPRSLGSALEPGTGRFVLLLEDLSSTTQVGDTVAGGTVERAALALQSLVGLQKPTWGDTRLIDDPWWGDHSRSHMVFTLAPSALPVLEERFGKHFSAEHLDVIRWVASVANQLPSTVWVAPFVMSHGDYRLDNMLFSESSSGESVSVIDWQTARLGPPPLDAVMFLGPNLEPSTRRQHELELLRGYHARLLDAGVEDYDFEACWRGYRLCVLYPLSGAITGAAMLSQNERDTEVWLRILRNCAQMCLDLDTPSLIGSR